MSSTDTTSTSPPGQGTAGSTDLVTQLQNVVRQLSAIASATGGGPSSSLLTSDNTWTGANTWAGTTTFNQTVVIGPPANSFVKGVSVSQSAPIDGSVITDDIPFFFGYNFINITADQAAVPNAGTTAAALLINYSFGGANLTGVRSGLAIENTFSGCSPTSSNKDFPVITARIDLNAGAGGTNTTSGAAGGAFGANIVIASQGSPSLNWGNISGTEYDFVLTNATVRLLNGVSVVKLATDIRGAVHDAGYVVSGNSDAYWNIGFSVSDQNGSVGVAPTGTILGLGATGNLSTPWTFAYGVDLRNGSFTDAAFASNDFLVDQGGNVTATEYKVGATTSYYASDDLGFRSVSTLSRNSSTSNVSLFGQNNILINAANGAGTVTLEGTVEFGTYTATPGSITGYITINDSGSTPRKIAVTS